MDTLLVWLIKQSMSWPACPITVHPCVPEYLCPSRACLFRLWCNQLELAKTGSAVDPPQVVVSVTTAPSWIPLSNVIRSGGEQGWDLFSCRLLRLSLPLKPQGLNGLSVREKNQSKRNLTQNCSSPAPPFSYFLHRPVFFFSRAESELKLSNPTASVFTRDSVAVGPD